MEKFCMALIVIALIVNCQLALAEISEEEITKEIDEAMADLKPKPIKVPQDVINRMMKAQRQMVTLQKEMEIIKVKLEGLNLARQSEFWLFLASIRTEQYPDGIPRNEMQMWALANGIAIRN